MHRQGRLRSIFNQSETQSPISLGELAKKKRILDPEPLTPITEVKILGGGKNPKELDIERRRKAHEDSIVKQKEKNRKRKAGLL